MTPIQFIRKVRESFPERTMTVEQATGIRLLLESREIPDARFSDLLKRVQMQSRFLPNAGQIREIAYQSEILVSPHIDQAPAMSCRKCSGTGRDLECESCRGSGLATEPCHACEGTGWKGGWICDRCIGRKREECPDCLRCVPCKGRGRYTCVLCESTGWIRVQPKSRATRRLLGGHPVAMRCYECAEEEAAA